MREAEEEVGVLTDPTCLRHVHTVYVNGSGPEPRLGLFFKAVRWIDESTNRESDKCSAVRWFPLDALPAGSLTVPPAGSALTATAPPSVSEAGPPSASQVQRVTYRCRIDLRDEGHE